MEINESLKQQFYHKGYFVIPNIIPQAMVRDALKAINISLGKGMPPEEMEKFNIRSFCPELMTDAKTMRLFYDTPVRLIAESLIGRRKVKNIHEAQIALRFPIDSDKTYSPQPHIDGFYYPLNGVEEGNIFSFTALVGIYLNDVDNEWSGNFTVWPESHRILEDYFKLHIPDPSLNNGIPPIKLPVPIQIKAKAGDLIFCHYQLAHTAAINISPYIRYALFFRIEHVDHDKQRIASMQNIWMEWEGIADTIRIIVN